MKRSLFAFAFIALAACDGTSPSAPAVEGAIDPVAARVTSSNTADLGVPFTLAPGQSVVINGEALTVEFQAVTSDSRCPTGVQCIWAGNATVAVVLSKDGKAAGFELNTTVEPRSANYLNYNIELLELNPYPSSKGGPISPSQYRATFVVTKTAI